MTEDSFYFEENFPDIRYYDVYENGDEIMEPVDEIETTESTISNMDDLQGLHPSSLSHDMKKDILFMMKAKECTERQLYMFALENLKHEVNVQLQTLERLQKLLLKIKEVKQNIDKEKESVE